MIYNGHDYQPYNSVLYLSNPSDLYIYYTLGESPTRIWDVSSYSSNVLNVSIDSISGTWYAFTHASYPEIYSYQDEVEIRRTNVSPAISIHFEWTTVVGTYSYSGPIWRDYIYQVPFRASRTQYQVKFNGNPIYQGWSYEVDDINSEICINDICRDYVSTRFPEALDVWFQDYYAERDFDLYLAFPNDQTPQTKVATAHFSYDWSYDSDYLQDPSESWIAMEPLQDYYDSRQFHIFSVNGPATLTDTSHYSYINSNLARSLIKTQLPTGIAILYSQNGTYSRRFTIKDNCGIRYCLYYVNSRGGWDSVLVDGVSSKSDKYERETYTQNYRTPSIQRGVIEYRNNITESWTLYLRSLGDSKNHLFHSLFESTNVYLHDLEEGRIVPVIITSREMQYKTRKNQGRKLYTYQIDVESSQKKLRM